MGQAVPRVQHVARSEARVLNGNARKERCRAQLLLPLADLALTGGFQYSALIPLLQRQVLCVDTTASTPSTLR